MTTQAQLSVSDRQAALSACADLITAFAHHIDRRDYDNVVALFTDDGSFERPEIQAKTAAGIRAMLEARPTALFTRHICHQPFFETVTPDEVRSITSFTLYYEPGEHGDVVNTAGPMGLGEFHDTFRRTADSWRIHRRVVKPVLVHQAGQPA